MGDQPWFRRRQSGLGWTPITWQGWLIVIVTAALAVALDLMLVPGVGRVPH